MNELKLNNKRTILVGLAFLSICSFWQMYDNLIPLILRRTFALDESLTGMIMAADNVLALFLLPLFGGLSDRCRPGKLGRRTPFILAGTAGAVVLMNLLPALDNSYAAQAAPFKLVSFVIVLGLLLIAMGTYRSPAVALMPDVTPKPLRSKANAIINLMGAVGGVLYLGVSAILYPASKTGSAGHVDYQPLFLIVSLIMVAAVAVLLFTIREPRLAEENRALEKKHPEWNLARDDGSGRETLPAPVKRSLGFLLASIALWFIGYNGVTTWWSNYMAEVMGAGLRGTNTCLTIATVGAIVSYIPIGIAASKFGRKRTIQAGVVLLAGCFLAGYLLTVRATEITPHHVRGLRPGGAGLGGHQRQLPAHGGGDVPGLRRGEIHRLLLHRLHGGPGGHPRAGGHADEARRLSDSVSLRRLFRGHELCHHAVRPPRRQQGGGQNRPGCL